MATQVRDAEMSAVLEQTAHRLDVLSDLDVLLDRIGDARYVLLGEASHGTSDY